MKSKELIRKVLNFEEVERIPIHMGWLPGVEMMRSNELQDVMKKYPSDMAYPRFKYGAGQKSKGSVFEIGQYTDEWGCVWHVAERGVAGEVKEFPLGDWSALDSFAPPWEVLKEADFSQVNQSCEETDQFFVTGTMVRPFERMQFLRGTENLLMDLAYGDAHLYQLRDMLHEFFMAEIEQWVKTDVEGIAFMDDWGSQTSLLISPKIWRAFFKPLYKDYCELIKKHHKFVFFHSDGCIESIYGDLIEIGVNAVNSQLFCMDIEKLGALYAGKIVFDGEIDRQFVLPYGTTEDVRAAVRRAARALIKGKKTGVMAECEWGINDPKENIEAVFDEWSKI